MWTLDLRKGGHGQRVSLGTKDRRLALLRANNYLRTHGEPVPFDRVTFEFFKREFLEFSHAHKAAASTEKERYAFKLIERLSPIHYLDAFTPRMADQLVTTMVEKKYSPFSVNSYIAVLRSVFNTARKWSYIPANPFSSVSKVYTDQQSARILTIDEIRRIFKTTRELRPALAPLFEFLLLTGCRRLEAISLSWDDIDFETGLVIFRRTKGRRPRSMIMLPRVAKILRQRQELPKPFDFKPHRVTDVFRFICSTLEIKGATLHDLRKSFSSYAQSVGMPSTFVAWLIGHEDESTTKTHYTGFYGDMIKKYLEDMERKIYRSGVPKVAKK